jgi:succinate dehydrogenase hydrophobic anchor subunit
VIPDKAIERSEAAVREDVLQALVNLNCDANLARIERTRRSMRDMAISLQEQRMRQRRNLGFALIALLSMLILLAPAVWNSVEDFMGGEHLEDFPLQIALLLLMLFPAMLAALVAVWKGHRIVRFDGRGS